MREARLESYFVLRSINYAFAQNLQVDLYVGKEMVQKGIPNEQACDALIDLIKANDRWVEKEPAEEEVVAA